MTPPKARQAGQDAKAAESPSAVSLSGVAATGGQGFETLRKRADFLRAARAGRAAMPSFLLQARARGATEPADAIRVGFTCTRKVGNAVARNRAKRRLRALARAVLAQSGQPGWDYVLVGRPAATIAADFQSMVAELQAAVARVHRARQAPDPANRDGKGR